MYILIRYIRTGRQTEAHLEEFFLYTLCIGYALVCSQTNNIV